jgi:hypothetical protein
MQLRPLLPHGKRGEPSCSLGSMCLLPLLQLYRSADAKYAWQKMGECCIWPGVLCLLVLLYVACDHVRHDHSGIGRQDRASAAALCPRT